MIDTRIKIVVQFHDFLYRFCAGGGTAIIELKLSQELSSVYQYPLFIVFFYIRKAYDNLDGEWILLTLAGYGEGPKLRGFLAVLWSCQEVVTLQNIFHGPQL